MNERVIAIVPIRSFRDGKTRLASALESAAREALVRTMAERVMTALSATSAIEAALVISPDEEVLSWAARLPGSVIPVAQPALAPGLDAAIDEGRRLAIEQDANAMLSIFADLPFVTSRDVAALLAHQEELILGTDRRRTGTNALFLRLRVAARAFRFSFGPESLAMHLTEARRIGVKARVCDIPGIAFDLDTPGDWDDVLASSPGEPALLEPVLTCEAPRR